MKGLALVSEEIGLALVRRYRGWGLVCGMNSRHD